VTIENLGSNCGKMCKNNMVGGTTGRTGADPWAEGKGG